MSEPAFTPEPEPTPLVEEPVVEPTWAPPREEWEQIRNFAVAAGPVLGHLAQQMQSSQPVEPQRTFQPQPEFDPFEPDSVRSYIQAEIENGVREALDQGLGPYGPLLESVASHEGEKQARAVLESLGEEVGSFDQDASMILAAGLMSQGNVAPEHALRVSAQYMAEFEKTVRTAERERYKEELATLRDAPQEHPVGPGAAEMETVPTGPGRYEEAVRRALARRTPQFPVG